MLIGWKLKQEIEKEGFKPVQIAKDSKYEKGKRYWCGYWQEWYDVLAVEYDKNYSWCLISVTVKWQDGETGTHCTQLDPRWDYELVS